jgi:hypothetical protein
MVKLPGRLQQAKPPDSEKLTVNFGFVDLGSIDLLVRDGFYSTARISSEPPSATSLLSTPTLQKRRLRG